MFFVAIKNAPCGKQAKLAASLSGASRINKGSRHGTAIRQKLFTKIYLRTREGILINPDFVYGFHGASHVEGKTMP
jgi:hypothetical protein